MAKPKSVVIASDVHGDEIDHDVKDSLLSAMEDQSPDIVVLNGDLWNFNYLRKGASLKEENDSASADWEEGLSFFKEFFAHGTRRIFLRGNHDERLWETYHTTTKESVRRHAEQGIRDIESLCRKHKVEMLPYDSRLGVLELGALKVVHGYACGVGAARKLAQVYGSVVYGHTHAMDAVSVERYPEPAVAMGCGCLLKIDQHYNARQLNKLRHEQGWVNAYLHEDKATLFQVKRGTNGKFYAPANFKAY